MTDLVVTKIAERGKKYDETAQCICSHDGSIVFLPRGVKPGELVRVRLIPVKDDQGVERKDARGAVMYRTEWALPQISKKLAKAISDEATMLRACQALQKKEGETVLRVRQVSLPQGHTDFDWYYFAESGAAYGSQFSPAALLLLEAISSASESGLIELLAWLVDPSCFKRRQSGQEAGWTEAPNLPDEKLQELQSSTGSWLTSAKSILSTKLA